MKANLSIDLGHKITKVGFVKAEYGGRVQEPENQVHQINGDPSAEDDTTSP